MAEFDLLTINLNKRMNELTHIVGEQYKEITFLKALLTVKGVSGRKLQDALFLMEGGETAEDALDAEVGDVRSSSVAFESIEADEDDGDERQIPEVRKSLIVMLKLPKQEKLNKA